MKALLFILSVLTGIVSGTSSFAQHQDQIKKHFYEVEKLGEKDPEAFDTDMVLKYTYPPLVDMMGGREKYLQMIESMMEMGDDMEDDDDYYEDEEKFKSTTEVAKIGKVYDTGEELQAVVEIHDIEVYSEDYQEVLKRYQLAISRDNGGFWYFVDGTLNWNKVVLNLHQSIIQPKND